MFLIIINVHIEGSIKLKKIYLSDLFQEIELKYGDFHFIFVQLHQILELQYSYHTLFENKCWIYFAQKNENP